MDETNMNNNVGIKLIPKATFSDAFGHGWKTMMKYFLELLLVSIIVAVAQIPLGLLQIGEWTHFSPILAIFYLFGLAYVIFVFSVIEYGTDFVYLRAVRDEKFDIKEMFSGFDNYLNVILASLLASAIIVAGFLFLLIPGIIFACKLAFVPYLVMDKKLDPVDAIRQSWEMTKGHGWTIFFMGLVSVFIIIGGLILLIIGVFPAAMWVSSAFASLYYSVDSAKNQLGEE